MRITIKPAGGSPFELAGHGVTSPIGLRINGAIVADVAEYLRASSVEVFDRGNLRTVISFSVTREHASVEAAQSYLVQHAVTVPRSGLVEIEYEQGRGRAWLYGAVMPQANSSHSGCSTTVEYEIIGGAMSAVSPYTRSSWIGSA
jgi:hypothetical protein